jgi:uncharacterized OsmC-like protein
MTMRSGDPDRETSTKAQLEGAADEPAWRVERTADWPPRSESRVDDGSHAAPSSSHTVSVVPRGRDNGFRATFGGNVLNLADPSSDDIFGPTPDDLFILAIAAGFAWSAREILRAAGLPDDVGVSAKWRTQKHRAGPADLELTVFVSRRAGAVRAELAAAMDESIAARSPAGTVHISVEGVY